MPYNPNRAPERCGIHNQAHCQDCAEDWAETEAFIEAGMLERGAAAAQAKAEKRQGS